MRCGDDRMRAALKDLMDLDDELGAAVSLLRRGIEPNVATGLKGVTRTLRWVQEVRAFPVG